MALEIQARKNGPYRLTGGSFVLVDAQGNEKVIEQSGIALCRCGQSKNKPFCDGSHRTCGFTADEVILRWLEKPDQ